MEKRLQIQICRDYLKKPILTFMKLSHESSFHIWVKEYYIFSSQISFIINHSNHQSTIRNNLETHSMGYPLVMVELYLDDIDLLYVICGYSNFYRFISSNFPRVYLNLCFCFKMILDLDSFSAGKRKLLKFQERTVYTL